MDRLRIIDFKKWIFLIYIFTSTSPLAVSQFPSPKRNIQIRVEIRSSGYVQQNTFPYQSQNQSKETQFLVVTDGLEGRLFIGKHMPYVHWYRDYLRAEGYIREEIVFRDIGTSLTVSPRIRGDQIEVTLTPEISYETDQGRGVIAVKKLSTTVSVPSGQSIEVGGGVSKSEFADNFYRRQTGEALQITLTPTVMEG